MNELLKIFEIAKKSDLKKHCHNLKIYSDNFSNLIYFAENGKINYLHRIYYKEIVPNDLQKILDKLPKINFKMLDTKEQSKLLQQLAQVIKVRRQLVGHMFINMDAMKWHFFYFDQHDRSVDGNKWVNGPHIHFINHLWPNHDAVYILKEFLSDKPHFNSALHIRYIE